MIYKKKNSFIYVIIYKFFIIILDFKSGFCLEDECDTFIPILISPFLGS